MRKLAEGYKYGLLRLGENAPRRPRRRSSGCERRLPRSSMYLDARPMCGMKMVHGPKITNWSPFNTGTLVQR